jgi:plastocyanin
MRWFGNRRKERDMKVRLTPVLVIIVALLALGAAGCGGGDEGGGDGAAPATETSGGGGGGGATLELAADPGGALSYDQTSLEAAAGTVTINLTNDSSLPHDVNVEGNGVEAASEVVTGGSTSLSADLAAGEYTFYCSVDGHRAAGMEGTLTVN